MSLYHKYRPQTLEDVYGNKETIQTLDAVLSREDVPHAFLLTGPTGTGKTTVARIIANRIGCIGSSFQEINAADFRGIDTIRDIRQASTYQPLEGNCRVWLIDECFVKGTKITMASGSKKNIEEVQVGDLVCNLHGEGQVSCTFRNNIALNRLCKMKFSNGQTIYCSKDHRFLTNTGWIEASSLTKDSLLPSPGCCIMQDKTSQEQEENKNGREKSLWSLWENIKEKPEKVLFELLQFKSNGQTGSNGDSNLSDLRSPIYKSQSGFKTNLFSKMWEYLGRTKKGGEYSKYLNSKENICKLAEVQGNTNTGIRSGVQEIFNTDDKEQSFEKPKSSRESKSYQKSERNITYMERQTRREWSFNCLASYLIKCFGVGNGVLNKDEAFLNMEQRVPSKLQSGYSKPGIEISNRSGRFVTSREDTEIIGQKKGGLVNFVRLESYEVYQRGNNERSFQGVVTDKERDQGSIDLYDLQIEGHPSYIANDLWVHNCHVLTSVAQNALLKLLEDPPKHVYLILATTDPQNLLATIKGRCATFEMGILTDKEMYKLLRKVVIEEKAVIEKEVYDQIIQDSLGHPRNALQILDSVLAVEPEMQLSVAKKSAELQSKAIELCRVITNPNASWKKVSTILLGLKDEQAETIRRAILGYCQAILLKNANDHVAFVMEQFLEPFYNTGFPGLTYACYYVVKGEN